MNILAHRGLWDNPEQKNQMDSFEKAFCLGFGIETDLRDCNGEIVISHDPPLPPVEGAKSLFELHQLQKNAKLPIALNIKSEGLLPWVKSMLEIYSPENYFCFDMSPPETILYWKEGIRFFTRQSEFESSILLYEESDGVWMDMFESDWIEAQNISRHLALRKQVGIISPEIHGREHVSFWERLKESGLSGDNDLMLCTDYPREAKGYFCA